MQQASLSVDIARRLLEHSCPTFTIGASGFGGSPHVTVEHRRRNIVGALPSERRGRS